MDKNPAYPYFLLKSMKIDTSQGNIEVIGDIKEFKTSIDPKNLEFITTLLSSNLYSDPEQSFIREIVSNAWDSHVEAGTTDIPVIVRFGTESDGRYKVTIRDYGVGLSPERFQEVYCNIGSSTKRESNDYIGGFGIGKYSSLACSNTVYITSYYEGTAYYYLMVKSGNSITTNLLMEQPTEEKNGVEVTIKGISDIDPYDKALQYIVFFPNVFIDGARRSDNINYAKLKRFNNFAAASISIPSKLLLGNVLYPVQKYHLNFDCRNFLDKIEDTGIVIKFNVGEINITPNRENIIYSSDTIKRIENRIIAAKKELDALVDAKVAKDYNDLMDYYNNVSKPVGYDPVSDTIITYGPYYMVEPAKMSNTSITYRGIDLREDLSVLSTILYMQLPNFKGVILDDKIYTKRMPWNYNHVNELRSTRVLVINSNARLVPAAKAYLRENYDGYGVMAYLDKTEFDTFVKDKTKFTNQTSKNLDAIISGIYESLMNHAAMLDFDNDPNYLQYKLDLSANRASDIKDIREAILYVWNEGGIKHKKTFKRFSTAVEYIKKLKKGVILANMDADDNLFSSLADSRGFTYIKARKDIASDIRNLHLKCIIDMHWLTNKDPMLSVVKTVLKYLPYNLDFNLVQDICENVDDNLRKEFRNVCEIYTKYNDNMGYRGLVERDCIPYDSYTEYICNKLKDYLLKHSKAKKLSSTIGFINRALTTAVVIKTKAYRVNGKAYSEFKNNELLNVLCRK